MFELLRAIGAMRGAWVLTAAACVLGLVGLGTPPAQADVLTTYGAVTVVNTVDGPAWLITSDPSGLGYGGLQLQITGTLTPDTLTTLSADYEMTMGTFGNGAPRFTLFDESFNSAWIYWGTPGSGVYNDPNFGSTSFNNTGNLVDTGSSVVRVEPDGFGGYAYIYPGVTWSNFLAYGTVGSTDLSYITLDLDGGSPTTQQMLVRNFMVNGVTYNPPAPQVLVANLGWDAPVSTNGAPLVAATPPVYAEQAVNQVVDGSVPASVEAEQYLQVPAGITYSSNLFMPTPGITQAVVTFTLPPGDVIVCGAGFGSPASSLVVDGVYFTAATLQTCTTGNGGSIPASLAYLITLATTGGAGQGWVQLGAFSINGAASVNSPTSGLGPLAAYTNNPANTAVNPAAVNLDCPSLATPCDISAQIAPSQAAVLLGAPPAVVMIESANELSFQTSPPADGCTAPIFVDMTNPQQPGTLFLQNCGSGPTDSVIADKGVVEVDEQYFLGANGKNLFIWEGAGSEETGTVTLTATCAGLMGYHPGQENIGSTPASCGIRPFEDETVYLNQITIPTPDPPINPGTGSGDACDPTDALNGVITDTTNGAQATFTIPLPNLHSTTAPPSPAQLTFYFEVCDKADVALVGPKVLSVLGGAGSWDAQIVVDCGPPKQDDCTTMDDINTMGNNGVGGDQLLTIGYNGFLQAFYMSNGGTTRPAYLRVVNDMKDYQINCPAGSTGTNCAPASETQCTIIDPSNPDGSSTCEPEGEVVCKVQADDGINGYASLWTNKGGAISLDNSDPYNPGLLTGEGALYWVPNIFSMAGIPPAGTDPNNPNDFGALLCFGPPNIHLEQFWLQNGIFIKTP